MLDSTFSDASFNEPSDRIGQEIEKAVLGRKDRQFESEWRKPLVGVASAEDPLFGELKRVVGPEHALPSDLLPEARSVIVFFLSFEPSVGKANDREEFFAARRWAESYVATNRLIAEINHHLKEVLRGWGYAAATTPATHNFDEVKLISGWSHKHLAYIAGLGTFGLHHLLITQAGCCGRLGSLVTDMPLAPTSRPQEEWCLDKAGYRCSACISKCRYGALSKAHFDRRICYEQCLRNDAHHEDLPLVDVCGKCACEVPCSYRIPSRKDTTSRTSL